MHACFSIEYCICSGIAGPEGNSGFGGAVSGLVALAACMGALSKLAVLGRASDVDVAMSDSFFLIIIYGAFIVRFGDECHGIETSHACCFGGQKRDAVPGGAGTVARRRQDGDVERAARAMRRKVARPV